MSQFVQRERERDGTSQLNQKTKIALRYVCVVGGGGRSGVFFRVGG